MRIVLGLPASLRMWQEMYGLYMGGTLSLYSLVLMGIIVGGLCSLNVLWAFKLLKGFIAILIGKSSVEQVAARLASRLPQPAQAAPTPPRTSRPAAHNILRLAAQVNAANNPYKKD